MVELKTKTDTDKIIANTHNIPTLVIYKMNGNQKKLRPSFSKIYHSGIGTYLFRFFMLKNIFLKRN